ncbi:MAG: autotransporter domain-containing protein [Sebaldella sp.]|nr:autotransporter domain-containing protein [Sebaldella sp.]
MVKNMEAGKSNESSYKLIQDVLNKRNQELKDLYLQGDYVVKPEYLEWQVFFSGFYNNSHRGGSKSSVRSNVKEDAKSIDLGMVIPVSGITRDKLDLNITPIGEPVVNVIVSPLEAPQITSPSYTYTDITSPQTPLVLQDLGLGLGGARSFLIGATTSSVRYNTSGKVAYENLNVESAAGTTLALDGTTNNILVTGAASYNNGAYTGTTAASYTHTGFGQGLSQNNTFTVHNISNNGNFEVKGDWNMTAKNNKFNDHWGFLAYNPYNVTADSKVTFSGNLNLSNLDANAGAIIGLSLDLTAPNTTRTAKAILENTGTITINAEANSNTSAIGMQLRPLSSTTHLGGELTNSGNIMVDTLGNGSGVYVGVTSYVNPVQVKTGNITLSGFANSAVQIFNINGSFTYTKSPLVIDGSNGKIVVGGKSNTGLNISTAVTSTGNNSLENIKNMNITLNGDHSSAIYLDDRLVTNSILNDSVIQGLEFGVNSSLNSLVTLDSGNLTIDSSLVNSLVPINTGVQNNLFIINRGGTLKNYMPITINSGAKAMMGMSNQIGILENYADIINNSSSYTDPNGNIYGGIGMRMGGNYDGVSFTGSTLNKGNISMNGDNAIAFHNKGTLTSQNNYIEVSGAKVTGVYGEGLTYFLPPNYDRSYIQSETSIMTDRFDVTGDNGIVIYSKGGNISLGSFTQGGAVEVKADGKDTFGFYFQKYNTIMGKLTLTSDVNASMENGAIAFYYEGSSYYNPVDISAYLSSVINTTNGNLNINADQNSYNIVIKNAKVNLSDLSKLSDIPGMEFTGSGKSKLLQSTLIIDTDSNIDKNNTTGDKTYRNMDIGKSGVSINSGVTLSGTEDGQVGIGQSFNYNDNPQISSSNSGTIDLKGANSIGIYNKRTQISNDGFIEMSGNNGIGLFTTAGNAYNLGEIKIGNKGIGIYSETYVDPSDDPYNSTYAGIGNYGKITANTGSASIGIYGNNNAAAGSNSYSSINIGDNSDIDVSASKGGIGIYSNKAGIFSYSSPGGSKISVGEDGVAIYAKDTSVDLYDVELNLKGNNSVGIYLDNSSLYGTGTINVDGTGIVVINKVGTASYNQNFNINSTAGSQYILQNVINGIISYDNTSTLGEGGTFVTGQNSAVLLGENSNIVSTGSNMLGIALNGGYIGGLPVTIDGEVLNQEATNKGNISFGDNSTGIYVINGASGENQGTIEVGQHSVGMYGSGTGSSIANIGAVSIGNNSAGMYLKDGNNLLNTGNITGTSEKIVGLYLEGNTTSTVSNGGTINLSGDKSIGIYTTGNGVQTINNTGTIIVGDSSTETDPSIGIYNESNNNIINNSGDISSGKTSIGIYNKGGQINQTSGTIDVGEAGVGIYTDSGNLNLSNGILNLNGANTVGIYAIDNAVIDNNMLMNVSDESFGIVLNSGSSLINRNVSTIGDNGVFVYSDGGTSITNELGADITMTGSKSVGVYMTNGGTITNKASITANAGDSNIGIYNNGGSIDNSGDIKIGDSVIVDPLNPFANSYAVGLYGENVQGMKNTGNIEIGADAVGFYANKSGTEALNTGNITSNSNKTIGIYLEGSAIRNTGDITLSGDNSIGIVAARNSSVKNAGIITMNGNESIGIYANANSKIVNENTGEIYINGDNSIGVQLSGGSTLENYGLLQVDSGTIGSVQLVDEDPAYTPPSIINAGIIKVDEKFDLSGMNIVIKSDPASFRAPTIEEITVGGYAPNDINAGFLLTNTVSIIAPSFDFGDKPIGIDSNFTQGTNARVYKFENVFDPMTQEGGPNTGEIAVKSGSLTFDAIPVTNDSGKIDIWMEKINYDKFTQDAWYDGFAKNIEGSYLNATGEALKFYDKLDLITDVNDLRNDFSQLSGSMYANITQREQNIGEVFNNTLEILQNSENNTKENVKINIIAGKGSTKEDTSGVESYDYETTGVLALREVERTYRHKFGYSLGYTRTDFQMKDTNNEDQADTVQIGLHNKYSVNGWNIKNDLLGRVSFHDVDRSVDWSSGTTSDLNSNYNVYGVSSLNELGKDLEINRNVKVTPYVGLELGYMMHPSFEEKGGVESLKVDSNDAYSVKPNIGVRLEGEKEFGATSSWKVKGNIGVGYEYELGNMNNQEKASLTSIEDGYHELAKAAEDKGRIKTSGYAGVELKETYGIYVTGEYGIGQDNQEDYKVGVSLKAMF